ncbi:MAG: OmpA family protein [Ignavibacteria bacterium]
MLRTTIILGCSLLSLLLSYSTALAQQDQPWGVLAGVGYSIHDASFSRLGTYPSCCPSFTEGYGYGLQAGGFYRIKLSDRFSAEGRLLVGSEGGLFTYDERSLVADIRDTLRTVRATFRHELDASILAMSLEPLASLRITRGLELLAGPRVSYSIMKRFRQTETLTQPEDYGAYLGSGRSWVVTEADIPNATVLRLGLTGGFRVTLPSSKTSPVSIGLEAIYTRGLSSVITNDTWSIHHLRVSAVVRFRRQPEPSTPRDTCRDCPPVAVRTLPAAAAAADISPSTTVNQPLKDDVFRLMITGVEGGDTTRGDFTISERSRRVVVLHPLLGHVYFDEGTSVLPRRYQQGIARALRDTMNLTPLQALQGELAIIAQRMKMHPDSWLSITGTTSSTLQDEGIRLARARAEEVRRTMNELGIYDDRMRVTSRIYPDKPTTFSDTAMGRYAQEENRRVELQSNHPAILAPIKLGSRERVHSPERIIVNSEAVSAPVAKPYMLRARRGDDVVAERTFTPTISSGLLSIDLPSALVSNTGDTLTVEITSDEGGISVVHQQKTIPISYDVQEFNRTLRTGDLEIERYGLILFEFDEARISKQHESQLQFIRSRIRENTDVEIIGATDQIGSSDYNRELSLKRAREVARRLGVQRVRVVGQGEDEPALPNDLPEGRASNRTVIIQLATPVK